jgi:stearoyl-CoA desaturase (delta-9 desaturase)
MGESRPFLAAGVLLVTYALNLVYITVFYHRAFTHGALDLHPSVRRFVSYTSKWVTGLDLRAWVCMHRIHHRHADTRSDPHSPRYFGIFGVALAQVSAYRRILNGLAAGDQALTAIVADLEMGPHWLSQPRRWYVGTLTHLVVGGALATASRSWTAGTAYVVGMASHPVQGWLVNSFGHAMGTRNFDTPDDSRNNLVVAWLVAGEGLQNNHHAFPGSARFSYRWFEMDLGYLACRTLQVLGAVRVRTDRLLPAVAERITAGRPRGTG